MIDLAGLLSTAERFATSQSLQFNLTPEDVVSPRYCPVTLDDLRRTPATLARATDGGFVPGNVLTVSKRSRKPHRAVARRTLLRNLDEATGPARESVLTALAMQNRMDWSAECSLIARDVAAATAHPCGVLDIVMSGGRGRKRMEQPREPPGNNWRALLNGRAMPPPRRRLQGQSAPLALSSTFCFDWDEWD